MEVLDKIKDVYKNSPRLFIYICVGLICIVLLIFMGDNNTIDESADVLPNPQTEYARQLEKQLKLVISQIEGVGKVSVMVTVEGTVEYNYQQDISVSENREDKETVIISNKEPLVKSIYNPKVSGVLVICDGGDNVIIKEKIIYAVSSVLDIPTNKVYITR